MTAFVDTSALYSLLVGTEADHPSARGEFERLATANRALVTTTYVLVETVALLQHRIGLAPVRDLVDRIGPLLTVRAVSQALHDRGVRRLLRGDRRQLSLVDCVSFEAMDAEEITVAFTFDGDFADAGYRVVPTI